MTPKQTTDPRQEIQSALCAAAQAAHHLQARYSLVSILTAGDADGSYDDFWNAVDSLAERFFHSSQEIAGEIERTVPQSTCDWLLGLHFGRCDAVARAALMLGLGWALVDRWGLAPVGPAH
jgi:hypothetical protein